MNKLQADDVNKLQADVNRIHAVDVKPVQADVNKLKFDMGKLQHEGKNSESDEKK